MNWEYCLGFLFDAEHKRVALIHRTTGWQANQYNGVGGEIKDGEWDDRAMTREWREETGANVDWHGCVCGGLFFKYPNGLTAVRVTILSKTVSDDDFSRILMENRQAYQAGTAEFLLLSFYVEALPAISNLVEHTALTVKCCLETKRFELSFPYLGATA